MRTLTIALAAAAALSLASCSSSSEESAAPAAPQSPAAVSSSEAPPSGAASESGSPASEQGSATASASPETSAPEGSNVEAEALRIAQTYMGYAAEITRSTRTAPAGDETALFAWLREDKAAWEKAAADLATEAKLIGLNARVDGIEAESMTSGALNVADGLSIEIYSSTIVCTVEATFIESGDIVSMAWAGPTCVASPAPGASPASKAASPTSSPAPPASSPAAPASPTTSS